MENFLEGLSDLQSESYDVMIFNRGLFYKLFKDMKQGPPTPESKSF